MADKKQGQQQVEWASLPLKHKVMICASCMVIALALISVFIDGPETESLPLYTVEKNECMKPYKCSYDIRLESQLSEEELSSIAKKIKKDSPVVDRTFIAYYLPCMKIGNGAWATSHFSPNLEVNINKYVLDSNPSCNKIKKQSKHSSQYNIEAKRCVGTLHCDVDVKITSKLSGKELTDISYEIKKILPKTKMTFIGYYLSCMDINLESKPWAIYNFTPELEINHNESELDKNPSCLNTK